MGTTPVAPTSGDRDPGDLLARARRIEIQRERDLVRRQGLAAGGLLLAVSISALPSSFLLSDNPPLAAYLVLAVGVVAGLGCLRVPWNWLTSRWLHAPTLFATAVVAAWSALTNVDYGIYYVLVAAYAGYAFRWRNEAFAEIGVTLFALLIPLAYEANQRDVAVHVLVLVPVLAIAAGGAIYVRGRMEAQRREYREFAEQALELALRIRGDAILGAAGESERLRVAGELARLSGQGAGLGVLPSLGRLRPAVAALGTALSVPLVVAGLAAAGVSVPDPVKAPFDAVGVGLPNQGSASDAASPAQGVGSASGPAAPRNASSALGRPAASAHASRGKTAGGIERGDGGATNADTGSSTGATAAAPPVSGPAKSGSASAQSQPEGGESGSGPPSTSQQPAGPLDSILNLLRKSPEQGGPGLLDGLLQKQPSE